MGVLASASLHGVPENAFPFTVPTQSVQVHEQLLLITGPMAPLGYVPAAHGAPIIKGPLGTPAQSCGTQSQLALR